MRQRLVRLLPNTAAFPTCNTASRGGDRRSGLFPDRSLCAASRSNIFDFAAICTNGGGRACGYVVLGGLAWEDEMRHSRARGAAAMAA